MQAGDDFLVPPGGRAFVQARDDLRADRRTLLRAGRVHALGGQPDCEVVCGRCKAAVGKDGHCQGNYPGNGGSPHGRPFGAAKPAQSPDGYTRILAGAGSLWVAAVACSLANYLLWIEVDASVLPPLRIPP